jgi:LmbE family N-acetylglucosaminyl deacetylase
MRVLAIAAHADDETLGCGGTLLRHGANGDELFWLVVTSPYEPKWSAEMVAKRRKQAADVATAYAIADACELGFPDSRLDTVAIGDVIEAIDTAIADWRPEIVYVVHGGDVHTDHALVFTATMSVLKAFRMRHLGVRRILAYETLSSTDAAVQDLRRSFLPTVFTDISDTIEAKLDILARYESELQPEPGPRSLSSVRALARSRGATIGVPFAEAFALVREIE